MTYDIHAANTRRSMRDHAVTAAGVGSGNAEFEIVVRPVPGTGATSRQAKQMQSFFERLANEYPWPDFGKLVVDFQSGKSQAISRTDTDNKGT